MTTIIFLAACILAVLFALLAIKTRDLWCESRARRKSEAAALSKRQHDATVAVFANVLREAALKRGR